MESASVPAPGPAVGGHETGAMEGDKGLKTGALGYLSNLVYRGRLDSAGL